MRSTSPSLTLSPATWFEGPTENVISDGAFQESVYRIAPYFDLRIDGITELNNNG